MEEPDGVRDLVAKLMRAVEASLEDSAAVRAALEELVRNGYEPRLILLADAEARDGNGAEADSRSETRDGDEDDDVTAADDPEETEEALDLRYELTKLDRDFLRTVRIRPESG
jgi:hypothetical protein